MNTVTWKVAEYSGVGYYFLKRGFLTVSGQMEFFTPADVLFPPDNIDLLDEQKQLYFCHKVLA